VSYLTISLKYGACQELASQGFTQLSSTERKAMAGLHIKIAFWMTDVMRHSPVNVKDTINLDMTSPNYDPVKLT